MKDSQLFRFLAQNAFKLLFIFLIVVESIRIVAPFLLILVIAALVALALDPVVLKLQNRFHWNRGKASTLLVIAGVFLVVIPSALFCLKGVHLILDVLVPYLSNPNAAMDIMGPVKDLTVKTADFFNVNPAMVTEKINQALASALTFVAGLFKKLLTQIPDLAFSIILFILSVSVLMTYFNECKEFLHRHSHMTQKNYDRFFNCLSQNSRMIFISNILTGVIQSSIVTIGALICGFDEIFLIFFVTFICSFFPVIGTAPASLVLSAISFYNGVIWAGILMLVFAGVTGVADNIVRPLTMRSGDTGLNPFVAFLAVIGGVIIYGIPGLFLGPLVISICESCLPIVMEDILQRDPSEEAVEIVIAKE